MENPPILNPPPLCLEEYFSSKSFPNLRKDSKIKKIVEFFFKGPTPSPALSEKNVTIAKNYVHIMEQISCIIQVRKQLSDRWPGRFQRCKIEQLLDR